jgi:hypothetical protein
VANAHFSNREWLHTEIDGRQRSDRIVILVEVGLTAQPLNPIGLPQIKEVVRFCGGDSSTITIFSRKYMF